jgi:predicted nucleic acid-binding protein
LIDAVLGGRLRLVLDDRILLEYREVLARPKFGFDVERQRAFLSMMAFQVHLAAVPIKGLRASDPDDTAFLEVAAASGSQVLVTGNAKHYPSSGRGPVEVLTPSVAVDRFMKS